MVSENSLKLLAQLIGTLPQLQQQQSQTNIARQILLNSQVAWDVPNYAKNVDNGGPSVVTRIFDILSRPNYTSANIAKQFLHDWSGHKENPFTLLEAGWRGFSGKDKTTYNQVLNSPDAPDWVRNQSDAAKAIEGLGLDIGLDPTTYLGPGLTKLIRGKKLLEVAPTVEHAVQPTEQLTNTAKALEAVGTATGTAPEAGTAIPAIKSVAGRLPTSVGKIIWAPEAVAGATKATKNFLEGVSKAPEVSKAGKKYGADFKNYMTVAKHVTALGRSPGYYGQVQRATDLLDRIAKGSSQAATTIAPKIPVERVALSSAQSSLAVITARSTLNKLKIPKDKFLNPKQQLHIFKSMLSKTTGTPIDRMHTAVAMQRTAEKYLQSQGFGFKFWDGNALKLTEVIDELGDVRKASLPVLNQLERGRINHPGLEQAVEAVRTRSAMKDAPLVKLGLDQSTEQVARSMATSTPAQAESFSKHLARQLSTGMQGARVAPASAQTAKALFKTILNSHSPPVQRAFSSTAKIAHQVMASKVVKEAKISREIKIARALEEHVGSPYRIVSTKLGEANKAVEFLGERFRADYGYQGLRPILQDQMLGAQAAASARHAVWRPWLQATTPLQRREAFSAAKTLGQAGALPSADPSVQHLAGVFRSSIENLFSSTGIKDTAQSVATRAAFTMEDVNVELRNIGSSFQFTNTKIVDALGEMQDFSGGINWLKSWEAHDIPVGKDAISFMSDLETATEKVAKRYALLDEVGARFGSTSRVGAFQHLVEDARLAGWYFPKETAVQVNRMNQALMTAYKGTSSPAIKLMDRAVSAWKAGVTIYAPSYHIRNMIGDIWLSWMAGVNNPRSYSRAARVLQANWKRYQGAANVEKLVGRGALEGAGSRGGGKIVRGLNAEQVYIAAHQRGLLLGARALEDIYASPLLPRIAGGRVQNVARGATELEDHYVRLAHFIDAIGKSKAPDIKQALNEAAHVVRKWHPDGMDLTNFERKYMRRAAPFYSWTRKAFPLVFESMIMKPGKVVAYPKSIEAMQNAAGIQANRGDPFPTDQLFPSWMKESGIGPIAKTGMGGPLGLIAGASRQGVDPNGNPVGGYTIMNPGNPMTDMISQFGGMGDARAPLQGAGQMLNPLARIPIEVGTDRQIFSNVPVSYDYNRYATEQIPGGAILSRLTNLGIGGPTVRGQREGFGNKEALINFLTAAGIHGSGPYITQAQRENQARNNRKKTVADFLKESQKRGGF